jgi:4-hydroxybenzoate polyprenyltransferase
LRALIGLLRTMRPKQWTKNIIIFAGIVFDGQLFKAESFLRVAVSFVLLCLAASAVYIINDLVDIERDRQHPKKRFRPLPSGELSKSIARISAVLLPVFSITAAATYSPVFAFILFAYIVINLAYSFYLKHIPIIDVMTIAAGFVMRVACGVYAITVARFSPWLYAVIGLFALFLAVSKRRQELILMGKDASTSRPIFKEYNLPLLDEMLRLTVTSTLITYILYTVEAPSVLLANTNLALITVPFVIFGLFRYLYLIHVKQEMSAPDEVALQDRPLQIAILLWGISLVIILYVIPRALGV